MSQAYLIYDERMELHEDQDECSVQVERPHRIVSIKDKLISLQERLMTYREFNMALTLPLEEAKEGSNNLLPFIHMQSEAASQEIVELAHSTEYYNRLKETSSMTDEELKNLNTIDCTIEEDSSTCSDDEDMYFCKDTFLAALLACGGVKMCVDAVTSETTPTKRALAIVRPPGHHACEQKAMGFCFFNSVVVAAKHAIKSKRATKVAILDWDIHHGNGSQDLTYDDPDILYISLHRYGKKYGEEFFPGTGKSSEVGGSKENLQAVGTNVNIAWTQAHMGNAEYATAMSGLILPLLQGFGVDMVFISCGLDAAKGDLLGDCDVLPSMYFSMTASILEILGDIPFIVALEGGYNTDVIATCMGAVALAVLDERWDEEGRQPQDIAWNRSIERITPNLNAADALEKGRAFLNSEYNHCAEQPQKRGNVKSAAIKDINKTIRFLRDTPMWKDNVNLCEIPIQVPESGRVTRSKRKKVVLEDMDLSFQSLTI